MNIFNNQETPGYDEIVSYGPKWWTDYKEMDAVYRFAGWTLDLMALWLEKLVLNQFPAYADEDALSIWESILRIDPGAGDSIDERRRTVAATLSGSGKFGASDIQSMIKAYSGCDSDIWWEDGVLQIRIIMIDEDAFTPSKINDLINRKLPAHVAEFYRYLETDFQNGGEIDAQVRLRMPGAGWDGLLNGSFMLNGSRNLDAEVTSESAEFALIKNGQREVL